ncbi:MAG: hypothetical protein ACK413_00125 [Patescibacteria group bacterium]
MTVFQKISEDKKFIFTTLAVLFLFILFLNLIFWQNAILGFFFSLFYFLFLSFWLSKIFSYFFVGNKEFRFIFGLFLVFYLPAFGLAIPIVFLKITSFYFYIFLLIFTLIISFFNHRIRSSTNKINVEKENNFKISKFFYLLFFIFYLIGWFFILKARTGDYLLSPWDVIPKYYHLIWFFLAFLLIFFIFSQPRIKEILFLIILVSLLFHAYLPFVSENSFGVDRWRHVGAERRLMRGEIEFPALIGKVDYLKIGPISLPRVFLMPNKFSYSNQWGMTIALSWLTQIDILKIDQYLIWFLWSIFFTIFVYKLSQIIFEEERLSLLITFIALFCFFSLQVGGAITIPHAIGLLPFLFFLIVFFSFLKNQFPDQNKKFLFLIIFSFFLLIFNYLLYLILALEIFIFGLVLKKGEKVKKIILPILIIIFIFSLPLFDRLSNTSFFAYQLVEAIKILPKKIFEFIKILPNYLYYKGNEKLVLSVKNFLWILIFTLIVFLIMIFGLFQCFRTTSSYSLKILMIFILIFLANQFISFSFMKNYRLLSTRVINVFILMMSIFFAVGLYEIIKKFKFKKIFILICSIFLSFLSLTTYISGPNYGNVTKDELEVARYIDQEIKLLKIHLSDVCIFDTGWRLLAVEAINGIIGGNFPTHPIDFVQKEKDELYRQMLKNPSRDILDKTLKITGAKKCFFVVNQSWLKPEIFKKIKELLGTPRIKNNTYIWQYTL